jgi:hypothetical protein
VTVFPAVVVATKDQAGVSNPPINPTGHLQAMVACPVVGAMAMTVSTHQHLHLITVTRLHRITRILMLHLRPMIMHPLIRMAEALVMVRLLMHSLPLIVAMVTLPALSGARHLT